MSYLVKTKAVTVRVSERDLARIMRKRSFKTQSELINTLLSEEAERWGALAILQKTADTVQPEDFDDRLL